MTPSAVPKGERCQPVWGTCQLTTGHIGPHSQVSTAFCGLHNPERVDGCEFCYPPHSVPEERAQELANILSRRVIIAGQFNGLDTDPDGVMLTLAERDDLIRLLRSLPSGSSNDAGIVPNVPRNPTQAMMDIGMELSREPRANLVMIWRAMYDAAPQSARNEEQR